MALALKVYGNPLSAAGMRVLACLYEKGLDFHLVRHVNSPITVEKNLFGEVAALEDGSTKIYGSRAITNYIACKYGEKGKQLIPSDAAKKGGMFELMDIEARIFDPVVSKLVLETRVKPILEMASSDCDDAVEQHKKQVDKVLDMYEERINKLKYFQDKGENMITLADVNHMPLFHYLSNTPSLKDLVHVERRPTVNKWCKFVLNRPAWNTVIDETSKFNY